MCSRRRFNRRLLLVIAAKDRYIDSEMDIHEIVAPRWEVQTV